MMIKTVALCILIFAFFLTCSVVGAADYQQIAGLIDLRTTFSDGAHDLESLVRLAKKRGFNVLFINDHDRMVMEYGLPPFRHILRKRVELQSINKGGAEGYLNSIRETEKKHPEMIIIPGTITAPFYYWTGSYFKKDLTAHNHEKRLLTIGLKDPKDYQGFPILHNGFSTRFVKQFMPLCVFFFIPLMLGIFLLRWNRVSRVSGVAIGIVSILLILNNHPFRSSPFDQYHGDQGIAPHQLLIDYVDSLGGMTFWNYQETRSGIRKMGPIFVHTAPYPHVLGESRGYTGFAALYGDNITVTEPGKTWDRVLQAYCRGERKKPIWGISTADFHKDGGAGEKLGNFPTVFLVQKRTRKTIIDAMKDGKMYACRGTYPKLPRLNEFSVSSVNGQIKGFSGDEIAIKENPRIKISLSTLAPTRNQVTVRLIRSGEVIETFKGVLPMEIDFGDSHCPINTKVFYRMDLHGYGKIVSNPIFVICK